MLRRIFFGIGVMIAIHPAVAMNQQNIVQKNGFTKLSYGSYVQNGTGKKVTVLDDNRLLISTSWHLEKSADDAAAIAFVALHWDDITKKNYIDVWHGVKTLDGKIEHKKVENISDKTLQKINSSLKDVLQHFKKWQKKQKQKMRQGRII